MKKKFKLFSTLLASATLFLISCKKEPEVSRIPVDPVNYSLYITIDQLPGVTNGLNGLSALISLTKSNGETVITDKPFALSYNGKYNTEAIPVQKGEYNLVKLIILKADGKVAFATPITGSIKASQVNKPLSLSVKTEIAATILNLQVIPVNTNDRSQDYGYLEGTFNESVAENPTVFSFTLKSVFTIGEVVYDSIPVSLKLTSYPLQGETLTNYHALPAGDNKITLPKQASKYTLSITKWGITQTVDILPANMKDGLTYTLGGSKAAKKLKYESVYLESGSQWKADTRKEYLYTNNDKISLIYHYRKSTDNSNLLEMKEEMVYENNRISQIKKSTNNQTTIYSYSDNGKLTQIRHTDKEGETNGQVSYSPGTSKNYSVGAVFESTKFYYKQNYNFDVVNGAVLKSMYTTTHGDTETTLYEHDLGINPFIHLHLPELSYRNLSIYNVTKRYATYTIINPAFDAYSFRYVYDAEGYPIELYTSYRVPGTATTAYTTKTVFNYY